jgi:hypothetical protein
MEPDETSIARQRLRKQVSTTTDKQATIEELLGKMFSIRFVQSGYKGEFNCRVEARSNISTVILRVTGGDEKEVSDLRQ